VKLQLIIFLKTNFLQKWDNGVSPTILLAPDPQCPKRTSIAINVVKKNTAIQFNSIRRQIRHRIIFVSSVSLATTGTLILNKLTTVRA
jgi:hypothetical protein